MGAYFAQFSIFLSTNILSAIRTVEKRWEITLNKDLRGSINYFIKWERPGKYDIRSGWYGQAWSVIGKKPTTSLWEYTIQPSDRDGFDIFYGSIHRGAYDFFYHDPWGFSKPSARIKIGGLKGEGTGVNSHAASILAGPDIRVWKKSSNGLNKKTENSHFALC
jgi:hypothetical protein